MNGIVSLVQGLGGDYLVMALVMASLVCTVLAAHAAFAHKGNLRSRLVALGQRSPAGTTGTRRSMTTNATLDAGFDALRRIVEHFRLSRGDEAQKTASILAQAGYRTREALVIYMGIRVILPLGLTAVSVLVMMALQLSHLKFMLGGCFAAIAGTYLPPMILRQQVKGRQTRFRKALPDALDLLVVCAEAGLGLDGALHRVSREFHRFQVEVAEELALTSLELGFLPNRRDALMNLANRVNIPSVHSLMHTLIQTERYGTPLSQALKAIAADLREERMLIAEEKAAKLPATMTVPMIVFILPSVFIVLIGPAIIQIMQNFSS
jgi:tight adherence protein C